MKKILCGTMFLASMICQVPQTDFSFSLDFLNIAQTPKAYAVSSQTVNNRRDSKSQNSVRQYKHTDEEFTFNMEEAVLYALKNNPQGLAVEKVVDASQHALSASKGAFGPSVTTGYQITHDPVPSQVRDITDETIYTWALEVTQPLFTGFNLLNNMQKAQLELEYNRLQVEKTDINIANSVQSLFLQYLMARESVASSLQSLERAKVQLGIARSGYNLGLRPKIDVLQAELDMSTTEATLIENENSRDSYRAQLNSMLNIPVDANVEYTGSLELIPFQMDFSTAVAKAFAQLPDVQMAQKTMQKAEKDLGIVKSTFYPQIYANIEYITSGKDLLANGNLSILDYYRVNSPDTVYLSPAQNTTFGITASMNLFSSGQKYYKLKEAKSGIEALEAEVELAYNSAALNVKNSLLSLQDAGRTVEVSLRSLRSARQSYTDAKMRYENQLGTNLEMLTAQSDLADAELAVISARASYLIALSNMYASLGEIHPSLNAQK